MKTNDAGSETKLFHATSSCMFCCKVRSPTGVQYSFSSFEPKQLYVSWPPSLSLKISNEIKFRTRHLQ